ncbi:hypothetical protein HHI36_019077 [Cryptolaemus montrouzieri]|uniref:Coiled-coil domain-containing protein 93 n=1 Tax=Cryptolaemus montrouzieri TaxID=559131 RepID=A0ABD2P233_9CUCU
MASKTSDLFSKLKFKRPTRQDGDGHENQVEVREDEEQSVKLQEIIDLLVAAGYFRARIKGLSSFDKVVGGMTWCIESCNVEVDVDLLFQENSTIGQKIALTEKIVAVLPKLQCPHLIEPHQIQGLDFIHIFPVIQWLVKRSLEFRTDTSDFVYSYALSQFEKDFPQHLELSEKQKKLLGNVKTVNEIYRPCRVLRKRYALPSKDSKSNIQITVFEYEYKCASNPEYEMERVEERIGNLSLQEHEIQQLMGNMTITEEESFDFEELTEKDREKLLDHHKNLKITQSSTGNQVANLKERKKEIAIRLHQLEDKKSYVEDAIEKINEVIQNVKLQQDNAESALKELELNDISLEKAKEVEEEYCKQELHRLQNLIEEAKKSKPHSSEEKHKEIHTQLEEQNEKLRLIRLQIAKKNRAISILQRRIDEVPSRAELAQYQKRFIELYNQISAKHKETKQYYSLYNTLEDTRLYMKKELSLLNSVSDSYPEAMLSKEGKEEFLQQFMNILEGVKQSKSKLDKRLLEEKSKRDELSQTLHGLVEMNRKYVAAVKQLKLECQKSEVLLAEINRQ